jgi:hypothetical protein
MIEADPDVVGELGLEREGERSERLWAKDRWNHFAVYTVRAETLKLNVANRRFRAERHDIERQLGRALDPDVHPEDAEAVITLALDQKVRVDERRRVVGIANPSTATLADDWHRRRQERPMWIRPDGLIVNGNRRWAMLRRLQEDEGLDGFEYVDVIVLGHEFDGPELFHMEAREQLTEGLKVRYGDVNLLLTLREAAELENIDWGDREDIERVAGVIRSLARNEQAYALLQLTAVKYMVAYLEEIGAPEDFRRMEGRVERFRDVARNMMRVQTFEPERELKMLELCFAAVRSNNQHGDLRELRRMLIEQTELFDELYNKVTVAVETMGGILPEPDPRRPAADEDTPPDDEETEDDGSGPADYGPVQDLINVQVQAARTTRESLAKSVRLAHAMLEKVDAASVDDILEADRTGETTAAVEGVVAWSATARGVLDERQP